MKKILLLSVCFITNVCFCQLPTPGGDRAMYFTDIIGNPLINKYDSDIAGSPFINNDWVPAKITFYKGQTKEPVSVKINIETNELYFRDSTGKEMIAMEGLVKKIECYSFSKDNTRDVFKAGYPVIDKQNESYYYRVYTEGEIELLAKRTKYIKISKNEFSGETAKEFADAADVLYIYIKNEIKAFHPNKSSVIPLLKDKEQDTNIFIDANKINFKKIPDLIKLFTYYNGLQ